jgi:hypothetical protein
MNPWAKTQASRGGETTTATTETRVAEAEGVTAAAGSATTEAPDA